MWLESYTVGPHMYHSTRLPAMGTNGTLERVSELASTSGYVRAHTSLSDAAACGMRQWRASEVPADSGAGGGAAIHRRAATAARADGSETL